MTINTGIIQTIAHRDKLPALLLAIMFFLLCCFYRVPGVCGVYHDDAIYVGTGKAIAQGNGYRLINLPNAPPQTKYPIAYPLLLSLIWMISPHFPQNVSIMQFANMALGALAIAICYLYFIRFSYCSRSVAFSSCLVCITSPQFLYFATNTMSEMLFLLLTIIALWVIERSSGHISLCRYQLVIIGIILSLPFMCRSVGIVCVIAGLLFLYNKRHSIAWIALGTLLIVLPWALWICYASSATSAHPMEAYYTDYVGWWIGSLFPQAIITIVINILVLLIDGSRLLCSGLYDLFHILAFRFMTFLVLPVGLLPWIALFRPQRRRRLLSCFLIGYLFIVCIWPWLPTRFLVAILPFVFAYLFIGFMGCIRRWCKARATVFISIFLVTAIIFTNLVLVRKQIIIRSNTGYPILQETIISWKSYEELFGWIKSNSSPEDIIASGLDSMMYLYTDRRSVRPFASRPASLFYGAEYPATGTVDDLCNILAKYHIRYIVQTPMHGFSEEIPFDELIKRFEQRYPQAMGLVYQGKDPRFKIFRIQADRHGMNTQ
jgi:hypothetical protein